jgi:hypothetical protein
MGTIGLLDLDMGGKSIDQKVYCSMISYLSYFCASRPDIMLSACMCTRFQAAPKECHLRAVERIMRYLILTPFLSLWYLKDAHFELIGYSDADYTGCKIDRKSTSRTCQFLGRIINYKTDMEFMYDGKHRAYQPHIVWAPAVPPPPPTAATVGTSAAAQDSPPTRRHAPSAAPESSRAATHQGKKQNILIKGLKILISMCCSNDAPIRESH